MNKINNILKTCLSSITIVYSINNIIDINQKINDNKLNKLNEIIADGCNFTYQHICKTNKKK